MNLKKPGLTFIPVFTLSVTAAVLMVNLFLIPPRYKASTRFSRPAIDRNITMEPRLVFDKGSMTSTVLMWIARSENVLARLNACRKAGNMAELTRSGFAETHSVHEQQEGNIMELAVMDENRRAAVDGLIAWSGVFLETVKTHARSRIEEAIAELKISMDEAGKSEANAAAALFAMASRDRALVGRESVSKGEAELWRLEALMAGLDATAAGLSEVALRAQGIPTNLKGGRVRLSLPGVFWDKTMADSDSGSTLEFTFPDEITANPASLRGMLAVWISAIEKQKKILDTRKGALSKEVQTFKTGFLIDDLDSTRLRKTWEAARDNLTAIQKKLAELEISRSVTPGLAIPLDQPACPDNPGYPRVALNTAGAFLTALSVAILIVMVIKET